MGRIGEDWWMKNERKCQKSNISGQKPVGCTGTGMQWATFTGTGQGCTGTGCSNNPIFAYLCTVKSRIRIPIV